MKGTCLKCGCTPERPCLKESQLSLGQVVGCAWIDEQSDLCSACAELLMDSAILPTNLAEACLLIRALRSLLSWNMRRTDELEQLFFHLAGDLGIRQGGGLVAPSEIWTPEGQ